MKRKKYMQMKTRLAIKIQQIYRGHVGRRKVEMYRISLENDLMVKTKRQALLEVTAKIIQRVYLGYRGRKYTKQLTLQRRKREAQAALVERCMRLLQRVVQGKLGRIRADRRRKEIAHAALMWKCARNVQRM